MTKAKKHHTLVSFLETTKPLVRESIIKQYPNLNMEYYDTVADMYFKVLRLMVVQEITAMTTGEYPIVQLINDELVKHGMWITEKGILLEY